jgi:hypothetical protein
LTTAASGGAVATRATIATVAAVTSQHRVAIAAHEGDADDRDENRDAQNQCTIHPNPPQNRYRTVRKSKNDLPSGVAISRADGGREKQELALSIVC